MRLSSDDLPAFGSPTRPTSASSLRCSSTQPSSPARPRSANRGACRVGFLYLSAWLGGRGAVGIDGLMEDAATAEICRAQLWQWIRHGTLLDDGRPVTRELVSALLAEEVARTGVEDATAQEILEQVALAEEFPEFLTLIAYPRLEERAPA